MFKRYFSPILMSALVAVFALAAAPVHPARAATPDQAGQPQFKLKLQTYYSPSTAMGARYFAEQVKSITGGRVEIQVFTGGELVGSANILKSVRSGMLDIGHGMGHHFTERKTGPLESGLPMAWMSAVEADVLYEKRGSSNCSAMTILSWAWFTLALSGPRPI